MKTYDEDHWMIKWIGEPAQRPWKRPDKIVFGQSYKPIEASGDTFGNLSEASEQVRGVEGAVGSAPDIRLDRVSAIREEIQRGEYKIDYDRIAENILRVFMDEMAAESPIRYIPFRIRCSVLTS
jgi:flagellar biosynthesis anti-sigma factor FlgM